MVAMPKALNGMGRHRAAEGGTGSVGFQEFITDECEQFWNDCLKEPGGESGRSQKNGPGGEKGDMNYGNRKATSQKS